MRIEELEERLRQYDAFIQSGIDDTRRPHTPLHQVSIECSIIRAAPALIAVAKAAKAALDESWGVACPQWACDDIGRCKQLIALCPETANKIKHALEAI